MRPPSLFWVIAGIMVLQFSLPVHAERTMRITTGFTAPVSTYYQKIFHEINRRYPQYHFTFEELSAERSLILANNGVNDGECCRIPAVLSKEYPNLIAVPHKVYSIRWVAFSNKPIKIKRWEDLKPYNAVTVTGWKLAEKKLEELEPVSLEVVRTPDIMMRLLDMKRAEVGVMGYMSGLKSIHDTGSKNVEYISEPLAVSPLYLMLNKKHEALVPKLAEIMETFDKDGTLDRLYEQTIKMYQ
jgi:polar amino acid transport system substrate-binding protein